MIIDSHIHISYLEKGNRALSDVKNELLMTMKKFGIDYSIAIPDNVPNPQCADLETLIKMASENEGIFATGTINVFGPMDEQIENLENLIIAKRICAIKIFPGHDPFYPTDERCSSMYELCLKYSLPVIVHTGENSGDPECAKYNDPKYLVEISKKYPALKIVIAHFFWPKMEYCYEITKDVPTIYYDTSAMADSEVVEATGGWDSVLDVLQKTISKKPNNVLFGTDWPMCPIDKHIQLIKDLHLNPEMEERIFSGNAIALYKLTI
ncbi:MAG: amidohydrolase family protein [Patescibacteria group bacterium]